MERPIFVLVALIIDTILFHYTELYALPGITETWDCKKFNHRWTRGFEWGYNSCFGALCEEDFKRPTFPFLEAFLVASGCKSLHELKYGLIQMYQGADPYPYYYCRLLTN